MVKIDVNYTMIPIHENSIADSNLHIIAEVIDYVSEDNKSLITKAYIARLDNGGIYIIDGDNIDEFLDCFDQEKNETTFEALS